MAGYQDDWNISGRTLLGGAIFITLLCIVGAAGGLWGCPNYRVYTSRLEGEALLRKAETERQVQIEDAKGKKEAAKLLAEAEVERAKGMAEAIKITGEVLEKYPTYMTFTWIKEVNANGNSVYYIPTEAGLPILEAGRAIGAKK